MTFTQQGETVTLGMTRPEYERLTMILGYATGAAMKQEEKQFAYSILRFTNEINNGNPNFAPYQIPKEFAG